MYDDWKDALMGSDRTVFRVLKLTRPANSHLNEFLRILDDLFVCDCLAGFLA